MASDGGLRPLFRKHLGQEAHWQSIETGMVTSGVPDANVCLLGGTEVWVEMKATTGWSPAIRPEQVGWHLTRVRMGGRTFFATRRQHDGGPRKGAAVDELWLCSGRWAAELRSGGLRHPDIVFSGVWHGGPTRWDWNSVRECLSNESI